MLLLALTNGYEPWKLTIPEEIGSFCMWIFNNHQLEKLVAPQNLNGFAQFNYEFCVQLCLLLTPNVGLWLEKPLVKVRQMICTCMPSHRKYLSGQIWIHIELTAEQLCCIIFGCQYEWDVHACALSRMEPFSHLGWCWCLCFEIFLLHNLWWPYAHPGITYSLYLFVCMIGMTNWIWVSHQQSWLRAS